jgi:hypothetical protein
MDGAQPSNASRRPPTCRPHRAAAGQAVSGQSTWQASIADTAQILDWHSAEHWSFEPQLCRHCRRATNLLDDQGEPSHKVCAEAFNSNTDS